MSEVNKVDLAVEELKKIGKMPLCPHCNGKNWSPAGNIISPIALSAENTEEIIHGRGYPMLLLACNNCGFTRSYVIAYLLDKNKKGNG